MIKMLRVANEMYGELTRQSCSCMLDMQSMPKLSNERSC